MNKIKENEAALSDWLAQRAGASSATIIACGMLSGGAIQENWSLTVKFEDGPLGAPEKGEQQFVLRTDSPSALPVSHSRLEEFQLYAAAFKAGVTVPEPLWAQDAEGSPLGAAFFVMRRVNGVANGRRIVTSDTLGGGRANLARVLGQEMARIHTIRPGNVGPELDFMPRPSISTARYYINIYRTYLDQLRHPLPIIEWGLRWLELNMPQQQATETVLNHNDFRTGNFMVNEDGVSGILDWEFAKWGERMVDIGWFLAKCWRFGNWQNEAGGIADAEDFLAGYEAESGIEVDRSQIPYWQLMGTIRWAIIACQQGERHVSGQEPSLELALTAQVLPELELQIMEITNPEAKALPRTPAPDDLAKDLA